MKTSLYLITLLLAPVLNHAEQDRALRNVPNHYLGVRAQFVTPPELQEPSGATITRHENGKKYYWTISDSFGENDTVLSRRDIDGGTTEIIDLADIDSTIENIDWETLDSDGEYLYLGDVGSSGREEIQMYVFSGLHGHRLRGSLKLQRIIRASYPEPLQEIEGVFDERNNHDVEASVVIDRHIYLIQKAKYGQPRVHAIALHADAPEPQLARYVGRLFSETVEGDPVGPITGACRVGEKLFLLSYNGFFHVDIDAFTQGQTRRLAAGLPKETWLGYHAVHTLVRFDRNNLHEFNARERIESLAGFALSGDAKLLFIGNEARQVFCYVIGSGTGRFLGRGQTSASR